jgi:hypothetical protein
MSGLQMPLRWPSDFGVMKKHLVHERLQEIQPGHLEEAPQAHSVTFEDCEWVSHQQPHLWERIAPEAACS